MSATTTQQELAVAAATALVRTLPAADLAPAAAALTGVAGLAEANLGEGAKAISATLSGATAGSVVVVVSAALAAQIENGPIPQELLAGLQPALADATAALGDVQAVAPQVLDADVALASFEDSENICAVTIAGADGVAVAALVVVAEAAAAAPSADSAHFESLSEALVGGVANRAVELLNDVEMGVTAELGRTRMTVRELLSMQPGSIVELDRAAGSPVDLLVNGTLVARGEVVVIDEEFGVRITEIIGYDHKKAGPQ